MAIKVSQATIDKIKKMGMTAALKKAPNANPEMKEALIRMYGSRRVTAAIGKKSGSASKTSSKAAIEAREKSSSKPTVKKANTTSNPFTGAFNKLSPYGDKNQKYVSGITPGATRKSVPGKPSIGEQISGVFTGKGIGNRSSATSVASTNAKRLGISVTEYNKRLAAAKKKK